MKKYFGQIVFNVTVAIMSVLLFGCTDLLDSAVLSILAIIATVALLSWGNYYFIKIASLGRKAFQRAYILDEHTFESLNQPEDYLQVMKDLKDYAPCRQEAARLIDQWEAFQKKSVTLNTISDGAGVYELVNQDIQSVMLSNMLLFMKRTAIIQSASHNGELNMHKDYLRMLTGRNEKILNDYTNLLIEVSQLTDSERKNTEIKSLSLIIESIHDSKKEMESEDI